MLKVHLVFYSHKDNICNMLQLCRLRHSNQRLAVTIIFQELLTINTQVTFQLYIGFIAPLKTESWSLETSQNLTCCLSTYLNVNISSKIPPITYSAMLESYKYQGTRKSTSPGNHTALKPHTKHRENGRAVHNRGTPNDSSQNPVSCCPPRSHQKACVFKHFIFYAMYFRYRKKNMIFAVKTKKHQTNLEID